jgi:hypothetical protein
VIGLGWWTDRRASPREFVVIVYAEDSARRGFGRVLVFAEERAARSRFSEAVEGIEGDKPSDLGRYAVSLCSVAQAGIREELAALHWSRAA